VMNILTLLLRGSILPGLTLACLPLLARAPASARRLLLSLSLSASLCLPFVSQLVPETSPARVALPALNQAFVEPVSASASSVARVAARLSGVPEQVVWSWEACAWALWALGALLVLAGVITARLRVQHMLRAASRISDDVVISDAFAVPAVVGVWPSIIVLPRESLSWCAERRRAVLAHERAHIAQRDALVQLLAQLACAVYWSVPWVWWAARRLRRECELSADARVVASGVPATSYAGHLIAIARNAVDAMPQGAIGMASELEQRICALVLPAVRPWSRGRLAALAAGMLIPAWFLACLKLGPQHAQASAGHAGPGIDARLQAIADEEAARASKEWSARDVMVVVLDPSDGAVLARSGETGRALVPGSTVKPFTVAAALEAKRLQPDSKLDCCSEPRKYGKKSIEDWAKHGDLDLRQTLAMSSNICTSHVYDALGGQRLLEQLHALHLGDAPGGRAVALAVGSFEGAVVGVGVGLKVKPAQLSAA
jgi:beta-lactamase regulating signal transducer with metallopeptidase domain